MQWVAAPEEDQFLAARELGWEEGQHMAVKEWEWEEEGDQHQVVLREVKELEEEEGMVCTRQFLLVSIRHKVNHQVQEQGEIIQV